MIYQVTFIVKNEADTKAVKSAVESVGGKLAHERSIGQRVFTYPIKGLKEGLYFTYHIDIDPAAVSKLDEALRFDEDIVRFLIVKTERVIIPAVPQIKPFDSAQSKEILPAVPEKVEKAVTKPEPVKETKPVKAQKKQPKPAKVSAQDEAQRLKTLEEKLEELLKE